MIEEQIQKLIEAIQANTEAVKVLTKQQLDYTPSDIQMPSITPEMTRVPLPAITLTGSGAPALTISPAPSGETIVSAPKPTPLPELPPPAPAPKPEVVVKTPPPKISDLPSLEMLTDLALKVLTLGPTAAIRIKELNHSHGIERITKCPPDKLGVVYASLKQLRKDLGGVE